MLKRFFEWLATKRKARAYKSYLDGYNFASEKLLTSSNPDVAWELRNNVDMSLLAGMHDDFDRGIEAALRQYHDQIEAARRLPFAKPIRKEN
jgi:hypothetical protein